MVRPNAALTINTRPPDASDSMKRWNVVLVRRDEDMSAAGLAMPYNRGAKVGQPNSCFGIDRHVYENRRPRLRTPVLALTTRPRPRYCVSFKPARVRILRALPFWSGRVLERRINAQERRGGPSHRGTTRAVRPGRSNSRSGLPWRHRSRRRKVHELRARR